MIGTAAAISSAGCVHTKDVFLCCAKAGNHHPIGEARLPEWMEPDTRDPCNIRWSASAPRHFYFYWCLYHLSLSFSFSLQEMTHTNTKKRYERWLRSTWCTAFRDIVCFASSQHPAKPNFFLFGYNGCIHQTQGGYITYYHLTGFPAPQPHYSKESLFTRTHPTTTTVHVTCLFRPAVYICGGFDDPARAFKCLFFFLFP